MIVSQIFFTVVPLIAFMANVFLMFTLLSAKKDASIRSFLGLLSAFILWTGGSYFMRMGLKPGVVFWWKISLTGIFLVPFMYYLLFSAYTEQRGKFLKCIWGILTVLMVAGIFLEIFMTSPEITIVDGRMNSDFTIKTPAVLVAVISVLILVSVVQIVRRTVKSDGVGASYLTPLFIGVGIMILGIVINSLPGMGAYPTDTLACAINAIFIYYAFYKKRFYALSQITSKSAVYMISLVVTGVAISQLIYVIKAPLTVALAGTSVDPIMVICLGSSALSILIFVLLNRLNESLFVREQLRREYQVKDFSAAVNSTLKVTEILKLLSDLIREEIPMTHMYLCMFDETSHAYVSSNRLQNLEYNLRFDPDHPLVHHISRKKTGFLYEDLRRSPAGKAMYESEKHMLGKIEAEYVLPFLDNNKILGFALLSAKENHKAYSYSEINYLESISSVASIALKNAQLYEEIEKEAQLDPLTGMLNRRALNRRLEKMFNEKTSQITIALFNLDDFSLYNELYGNEEGDIMLQQFGKILHRVFGIESHAARYGGKEFAVVLPHVDVYEAKRQVEEVRRYLDIYMKAGEDAATRFLTFSAGICSYPSYAGSMNQLISYANMAVMKGKQDGKNKTEIFSGVETQRYEQGDPMQELTSTIYALTAAIDAKDHYTFNHSRCVSEYAAQLAVYAGLNETQITHIRQAGLLHDIGKIGIPDAILGKTGRLTNEEFAIMRKHVERSIEMIRHLPSLDYVIPAVLGHHERYDGRGYPRGIAGEAIPVTARCLSIADSFDAMVSKRSYKDKLSVEVALGEIERNLGSQFDPALGSLFVQLVREGRIQVISY